MVTVISLPLGSTATFVDGVMAVLSRRTCAPDAKPEPKICTPARWCVEVRAPCGTRALGMPPMSPGPGLGLGTSTWVISVDFGAFPGVELKLITWMTPLPDCTTKAWFVAGSTAAPPPKINKTGGPIWAGSLGGPPCPCGILNQADGCLLAGSAIDICFIAVAA